MHRLLLMGVNHKVAPIELRERLAFNSDGVMRAIGEIAPRLSGESEVALLSTCNRTELILHSDDPCNAEALAREFICETGGTSGVVLDNVLYTCHGEAAARHLLRVATGLDSLVVGENEIQGQVRTALKLARAAGTSGPFLDALFRSAIQCGKRVRTETEIGRTNLSVATLVVELAEEKLGSLMHRTALLVGAGKISKLTARELVRAGLRCVLVANRTFERAQKMVKNLGSAHASAVHFDQLNEKLTTADIVICSTGAPHIVLKKQPVVEALEQCPNRSMLVIDLAIPRDADPAISQVPNVELFSIDDLSGLVQERHPLTAETWQEAETIVDDSLSLFVNWYGARRAVPLIRTLRDNAEAIVKAEVEHTAQRLGPLSSEQRVALEHMGQAIVNKLLHDPICCLKNMPDIIQQDETLDLVRSLFGIEDPLQFP